VLPGVKRLAALGVDLTLLTFEKPQDLERPGAAAAVEAELTNAGVRWIPLRYHKRPKLLAKALDFGQAWLRGLAARLGQRFDLIHARTFLGGLMGLPLARIMRARFVYHNEGFYPDEQVDAGVWRAGSLSHRIAKFLERQLYSAADGIIALSRPAQQAIGALPAVRRKRTPSAVVPSCVDLDHFRAGSRPALDSTVPLRFVYAGSVGGRYLLDRIARFVALLGQNRKVHLQVCTRTDFGLVQRLLREGGLAEEAWSTCSVPQEAMPDELVRHHVGLHFLTSGLSEHGGSPTKIGEYWACGLPVVATPNMGDIDTIIRREQIGVIVQGHTETDYRDAADQLDGLLHDPEVASRCRQAAEKYYGLAAACKAQVALYRRVLRG